MIRDTAGCVVQQGLKSSSAAHYTPFVFKRRITSEISVLYDVMRQMGSSASQQGFVKEVSLEYASRIGYLPSIRARDNSSLVYVSTVNSTLVVDTILYG